MFNYFRKDQSPCCPQSSLINWRKEKNIDYTESRAGILYYWLWNTEKNLWAGTCWIDFILKNVVLLINTIKIFSMWLWKVRTDLYFKAVTLYTPIQGVFSTKLFPDITETEICWAVFSSCTQILFLYVTILSFQIHI